MKSPGRRLFIVASVFLVLMGVMHGVAQLTDRATDPALIAIEARMRSYHVPLGLGMSPSLLDLDDNLGFTVTFALLWLGLMGIVVATADSSPRLLRRMTVVNLAGCTALLVVQAHYRVPPPLVSLALIEVLLVLSLLRQAIGQEK